MDTPYETIWHKKLLLREALTLISGELEDIQRCGAGCHPQWLTFFTPFTSKYLCFSRQDLTMRFFISNLENSLNTLIKTLDWKSQECLKALYPTLQRAYCWEAWHCSVSMVDTALAYDIPTHFTMHDYFYALNSDFTLASETLNSNYDNKRTQDTHAFLHAESKRQHVCHSLHFLFSVSIFPILVLSQPNLVFYGRSACL